MKCQSLFSGENKINILKRHLLKFLPSMLSDTKVITVLIYYLNKQCVYHFFLLQSNCLYNHHINPPYIQNYIDTFLCHLWYLHPEKYMTAQSSVHAFFLCQLHILDGLIPVSTGMVYPRGINVQVLMLF